MILATREPYRDRKTWSLGTRQLGPWQVKVYGILGGGAATAGGDLTGEVVEAALEHARKRLPSTLPEHPLYGFLTVHRGQEGVWLLVDLWFDDILHHFLYRAPLEHPADFGPPPSEGILACVWELQVVDHERRSWVHHVLARPQQPAYDAYLADRLEIRAIC